MKVLILGLTNSEFVQNYIEELTRYKDNIDVYLFNPLNKQNKILKFKQGLFKNPKLTNTFRGSKLSILLLIIRNLINLKKEIRTNKFDVVHIFFLNVLFAFISKTIKKHSNTLVVTIFGSDFYRNKKWQKKLKKKILQKADFITTTNPQTINDLTQYYKSLDKQKIKEIRFGNNNLEIISNLSEEYQINDLKKKFNFPLNKKTVMIGYSGNRVHQHIEILQHIVQLNANIQSQIHIVIPLSYGNQKLSIKNEVINFLSSRDITYTIIDSFLSSTELSSLRIATDIFISLPKTDQFSRTLKENIFVGNYVITGEWLPYKILDDNNIDYFKVSKIEEINTLLKGIITSPEIYPIDQEKNRTFIYNDSQWSEKIKEWSALY